MKRAKIILSVLGILAVTGSVLAFKSIKAYSGNLRCSTFSTTVKTTATSNNCPQTFYSTAFSGVGRVRYCTIWTAPVNATCYATWVTVNQ
jgi:hypothetical protein